MACLPINEREVSSEVNVKDLKDGLMGRNVIVYGWGHTKASEDSFGNWDGSYVWEEIGVIPTRRQHSIEIPILDNDECSK